MQSTIRSKVVLSLLMLLIFVSGQSAAESAFKVCADPNNPPLSQKDGGGYGNAIAELFAKTLNQKLEYTWFPQRLGFIRNTLKMKPEGSDSYLCDVVIEVPQGFEMAATTRPYYRSTYAMVYVKNELLRGIKAPSDLDGLSEAQKKSLRIAMFDGGAPGTTWLLKHGLMAQAIPYQSMTGDSSKNTAQVLAQDFKDNKIDVVIVWGPIAGYLVRQSSGALAALPMQSEAGIRFDFAMSMGVRFPDKERKALLDDLIVKKAPEIESILKKFEIPLLSLEAEPKEKSTD